MSDKGVCRPAPATPGLVNIFESVSYWHFYASCQGGQNMTLTITMTMTEL